MARGPRRLRNLNLDDQNAEHVQGGNDDNEEGTDDNLEGPPETENVLPRLPPRHKSPIMMRWANGEVRQILGDFRVSDLLQSRGGKVIVETDENGVPNDRSASILGQYLGTLAMKPKFAPLHIERWDSKLYEGYKTNIIKDVEGKFIYPTETKQLTRDWVLQTVNNIWRALKSKLKKKYFNPQQRSLAAIEKDKPEDVNEHQWSALVAIWCGEKHKQLCATNSRCANEQKNPHTTGRKSHARLKKEMEDERNGRAHRIELWDKAHTKKDGRYANRTVQIVMDTSFEELAKRKVNNNGIILEKDYEQVFDDVVAKESKPRGYYDDKYWSQVKVSQGLAFVDQPEANGLKKQRQLINKVERMQAFLERKFPGEDWTGSATSENDEVERVHDNIQHDCVGSSNHDSDENHEESSANAQSPRASVQVVQTHLQSNTNAPQYSKGSANSSMPQDNTAAAHNIKNRSQGNKSYAGLALPRESLPKSKQVRPNNTAMDRSRPISIAEQLLIIHEECLQNNFSSIEKLRNSHVQGNAVSQSRQIVADDDDESDSSDDGDETTMMDDMAVDRPRPPRPTPDADGWTVVPPRRGGRSRN